MNVAKQFQSAAALHRAGKLAEARKLYEEVLRADPNHIEAMHGLGSLAGQSGQLAEAESLLRRVVVLQPNHGTAYNNLANTLKANGRLEEAIAAYTEAIRLLPRYAMAFSNLGNILREIGELDRAIALCAKAVQIQPDYAEGHYNLGLALQAKTRFPEAGVAYRRAIQLKPDYAEAHNNLGIILRSSGEIPRAIAAWRCAIAIQPNNAAAHNNLANTLYDLRYLDEAIAAYLQAVRCDSGFAHAYSNLAVALREMGRLDEAIGAARRAIEIDPNFASAHNNLGNALKEIGELDEAITAYRRAIELKPDFAKAHSNLILALHYHPDYDSRQIHEELMRWNAQHRNPPNKAIRPHENDRDPERRLRIGYVSPDFREHVVGQNLLPLLRQHDHGQFEIVCYSSVLNPDSLTGEIRGCADVWREAVGMSDVELADQVRRDRIDILVELSNHSAGNWLVMMTHKPAPVQASWLGYPGSTGVEAIDYRVSDPQIDPTDADFPFYSERTIRLPDVYWCYGVPGPTPPPAVRPALGGGAIRFGCLNNFVKVSRAAQDLWAEILRQLPGSRLIVHSHPGSHLETVRGRFAERGISADRIEFVHHQPWEQYVQTHSGIDIALDPFPWSGGITTCNALWMGVPAVTLFGRTAVGRGSASILSSIGARELIARSPEEYVRIAVDLSRNPLRLGELSASLRARMQASPLMDAARFARSVEKAHRQMWQAWCR